MRFDGRVVLVTGGGRGLGRSYARLLGSRGARVVVSNRSAEAAEQVADEIIRSGGEAVPAIGDLTHEGTAAAVVATALEAYGRVDALINNAGVAVAPSAFPLATLPDLRDMLDVHVCAPWRITQEVWPHFVAQGYGRIVFTSSTAVFGHETHVAYTTAKSAVIGLARCLSVAGAGHGILVNTIMPTAQTRLSASHSEWAAKNMTPDHVAPLVAVLAHEDCPASGQLIAATGGCFQLVPLGLAAALTLRGAELEPERLLERFDALLAGHALDRVDSAVDAMRHVPLPRG
jgi:NAD(P)-dependent dehydrogenase (short-subunit alcohol dehydrogenase family)